jgi:hypothetical protein
MRDAVSGSSVAIIEAFSRQKAAYQEKPTVDVW